MITTGALNSNQKAKETENEYGTGSSVLTVQEQQSRVKKTPQIVFDKTTINEYKTTKTQLLIKFIDE